MNVYQANAYAERCKGTYLENIYKIVAGGRLVGDSIELTSRACEDISHELEQEVKSNLISKYGSFQTPSEAYHDVQLKLAPALAGDSAVFNGATRTGTLIDPTIYTHSTVPIMVGPMEATNLYAGGGLLSQILDKKSRGMVSQGASFKVFDDEVWSNDKVDALEEAAEITGFNAALSDASSDAVLYGGSILFPVFKGDTPFKLRQKLTHMDLEPGCIARWVNVDRWNVTIVPSYIITAKDYLRPSTVYIPQSGMEVSTTRAALIRPRALPYWAALYNIGWAPSDLTGWLRAYFGYQITCQSVPVMAQQMSLLLYRMPLDALNAGIGHKAVKDLMALNEEQMAQWNTLSPKAVNMVGDVEVVERTFSGFDQFMGTMKSHLASECGIPEPSLWHTPNKGFSDNTTESLLKQSETLQMAQRHIERAMPYLTDCLIAHVFGMGSPEWEARSRIRMIFNKPIVSTEKDLAEVGARFAASISSLAAAGLAPKVTLSLVSQFFPTVKLTQEIVDGAQTSYEEQLQQGSQLGMGMGHSIASAGINTGKGTKAGGLKP